MTRLFDDYPNAPALSSIASHQGGMMRNGNTAWGGAGAAIPTALVRRGNIGRLPELPRRLRSSGIF